MTRMLGGWIALTPELPAKILMGRHVWDCAQHADRWGRRLPELRAPAQQSEPPGEEFVGFMDALEQPEAFHETPERLAGIYRVLKPSLLAAYERHLAEANPVYEPPTRRILQVCIEEERRHIAAGDVELSRLASTPQQATRVADWVARATAHLARTGGVAGDGVVTLARSPATGDVSDVGQDLIQIERPADRWPIPDDLTRAVDAHGRAILARDLDALAKYLGPEPGDSALAAYRELTGFAASKVAVVACAKVGGQWLIKQRVTGAGSAQVLQARWVPAGDAWRVAEIEVVRRESES